MGSTSETTSVPTEATTRAHSTGASLRPSHACQNEFKPLQTQLIPISEVLEHRMMLINGRCDFRLQVPSLPIASLPTPFDIAYKNEYSGATKTFARAISEPVLLETPTAFDLRDPSPLDSYVRSPHYLTNLCVQYINTSNDPDLKRQYHPGTTLMPLAAIRTVKP